MNLSESTGWFSYLPVTQEARRWGIFIVDSGFTHIGAGSDYPPNQHPEDHHFTWDEGRILNSFTLVYITRGGGILQTNSAESTQISEGDVFILFPGEWHRYRPDEKTGWDEYWVEFDGDHAQRIMDHHLISKKKPVIHVGQNDTLLKLFLELSDLIRTRPLAYEYTIAAQTQLIVARLLAAARRTKGDSDSDDRLIRQACFRIHQESAQEIDFEKIAHDLGLCYTGFRRKFRRVIGMPPAQFQQQLRLNRARHWLIQSNRPITEIAVTLGYDSIFYFSRIFKRKTGLSPTEFRKKNQPKPDSQSVFRSEN